MNQRHRIGVTGLNHKNVDQVAWGQVQVLGYDNIEAINPMLQDGRVLATADQFASQQAVFGINTALDALKAGKKQRELSGSVETPVKLIVKQ